MIERLLPEDEWGPAVWMVVEWLPVEDIPEWMW